MSATSTGSSYCTSQALPPVSYPRTPGYRPQGEENRYGAWYVKTTIEGAADGKLKGKRVAVTRELCSSTAPATAARLGSLTP